MTDAIRIRNLAWRPGKSFSLEGMDLTVPSGSIYGFLGPNGSGKTSTMRLLLGMARPQSGTLTLLGEKVPEGLPRALARIGYVPEKPHLYPGLTVRDAIRVHGAFFGTWDEGWAEEIRKDFRLDPDNRVGTLSKGERGKLLILLALAQRPELLVLDEPTDGLDPVVRRDVLTAVLDYVSAAGATVFISSHLVHELERFCDWVGVLENGKLLAEMPLEAFRKEIRRVRVEAPPRELPSDLPFDLLARRGGDGLSSGETWIVRGWAEGMEATLGGQGARVREVAHLDLEESFVELLRAARPEVWGEGAGGERLRGTASNDQGRETSGTDSGREV